MYRTKVAALFVVLVIGASYGQIEQCPLPTEAELEDVIGVILLAGDSGTPPEVVLMNYQFVCNAFGDQEGMLRQVSVVVEYNCTGHANCPTETAIEQIESECDGTGSWSNIVAGTTVGVRLQSPTATLTTSGREDCAFCLSPTTATAVVAPNPDDINHCVACNSRCEGLMRCTARARADCCNYYNNSQCVDVCPVPFTPNPDTNDCVCPEGTFGFNCSELVDCGGLTNIANGSVALTGTVFESVATYSCDSGFALNGDETRICQADGLWSGEEPTCEEVNCEDLSEPENGDVMVTGTTLNSIATYSCNDGYALDGETMRTCLSGGVWSGEEPTCKACPANCLICKPEECIECEPNYEPANGICKCLVDGCVMCSSDGDKCDECEGNMRLNDAKTACVSGGDGGGDDGLPGGAIAGIILALIVLAILLATAIALIAYFAKRHWDHVHTKSHNLNVEQPKEAHENPLYVGPETALEGVDKGTAVPLVEDGISPSNGELVGNGSE